MNQFVPIDNNISFEKHVTHVTRCRFSFYTETILVGTKITMKLNFTSIYILFSIYHYNKIVVISSNLPTVNALKQDLKYTKSFETDKGSDRRPPIEGILLKSLIQVNSDTTVEPPGQDYQILQNIRTKRDTLEKST